ncbi:MAG: hypothetical protein ACM3JJ_00660 [Hyphomicrobiales bacterium]
MSARTSAIVSPETHWKYRVRVWSSDVNWHSAVSADAPSKPSVSDAASIPVTSSAPSCPRVAW